MEKQKTKYEEVNAYPSVGLLSDIEIEGKDTPIRIGGWSIGGFYLEEPYILKEEKSKNLLGKNLTYYGVVKDKELQSKREKEIREHKEKQKKEAKEWKKNRKKEIKEELKRYEQEDKRISHKHSNKNKEVSG